MQNNAQCFVEAGRKSFLTLVLLAILTLSKEISLTSMNPAYSAWYGKVLFLTE
jgi:hypothetical protein